MKIRRGGRRRQAEEVEAEQEKEEAEEQEEEAEEQDDQEVEEQAEGKEEQEEDAINVFCCPERFLMHEHDMDEKNDKARNIDIGLGTP